MYLNQIERQILRFMRLSTSALHREDNKNIHRGLHIEDCKVNVSFPGGVLNPDIANFMNKDLAI